MPATQKATLQSEGQTQAQVKPGSILISFGPKPQLANPKKVSYEDLRALRKDPTIALARAVAIAPAVLGEWSIESEDDVDQKWIDFAASQFLPIRAQVMEVAISGGIDFGWQPFEKVFKIIEGGDFAGKIGLRKLKPLLHDLTVIMVEQDGSFAGFWQEKDKVVVRLEESLLIPFRVEGTQWHGTSLLENARAAAGWWQDCNDGAARYDKKVAGAHWVVTYPSGQTEVTTVEQGATTNSSDGLMQDNRAIARDMLNAMQSSGSAIIPGTLTEGDEWKIELLSDGAGKQITFVPRLQYLDAQKVRAMLMPERVVTEGKYGTKAEAETHTDTAVTVMQMTIEHVTNLVSWHVLDQLLELNFGPEARGKVWLASSALVNAQADFMRKVYDKLLSSESTLLEEYGSIDTQAMKENFGIPTTGVEQDVENLKSVPLPGEEEGNPVNAGVRRMYQNLHGMVTGASS